MGYKKESTYVSHPVDAEGNAAYTNEENKIWHELITRQAPIVHERACDEYMHGIELLQFPQDRIPQCGEISTILREITGWALEPVPALIPFAQFFNLLANQKFPAATFIRRREDFDYLPEPDIFHEIFGHCPLLTNKAYADFTQNYGKLGLNANPEDRAMLAKIYWFTIEFGLMQTAKGLRAYGGGILSSVGETPYSLESNLPQRKPFDIIDVLRTPYRIDIMQPVYFVIDSLDDLFKINESDLLGMIKEARKLGMHPPTYPIE